MLLPLTLGAISKDSGGIMGTDGYPVCVKLDKNVESVVSSPGAPAENGFDACCGAGIQQILEE